MMATTVVFHGTRAEGRALTSAIARNCDCTFVLGVRTDTCLAHDALLHSQRFVDGLLYARRYWARHCPNAGQRIVRP